MSPKDHDAAKNRDDELEPGRPPRNAHVPAGSTGNAKTLTDPASGEPQKGRREPPASKARR